MMAPAARATFDSRRILVVEDEYLVAEELRNELEAEGAVVVGPVPSVAEALDMLDATPLPDAAILDVNLGGEKVFPVADVLARRRIPFVFSTGYDAWALPAAYADLPRCEKPVNLDAIRTALLG